MQPRLKIGVLYSRVRVEEKWIFGAMEKRGIDYDRSMTAPSILI